MNKPKDFATIGILAVKWEGLRIEAKRAREARAGIRDHLGACKKTDSGESLCWAEGRVYGNDWCESCEAQDPLHKAYMAAVRKAAAALTSLRREARKGGAV